MFNIVGNSDDEDKKFVLPNAKQQKPAVESILETPKPGFCVKTRTESGEKIFVNFCTSDKIGQPPNIGGDELREILETEDVGRFRVPMSVGPGHSELDKSGGACTAYDVVIHPDFCAKVRQEDIFLQFLLSATMLILEQKYEAKLDNEACVILKNKRHMGRLEPQLMRLTKKPFVVEMEDKPPAMSLVKEAIVNPLPCSQSLTVEPAQGKPEFIVVEITSKHMKSVSGLQLDVGEDRLELLVRPGNYRCNLDLPHWVHPQQGGAQFHCQNSTLTITLPVQEGEG